MDNVHVAIRVRPLITRESNHDIILYWKVENSSIHQVDAKNKVVGKPYTFDYVFHMGQSTNDVYEQVAEPIIESAMDGYDGTIFAYGQTSSGKTFTMQGNTKEPGIIPKAIDYIFDTIEKSTDREYLLRVCYMELYNEVITDLLCKDGKALHIREQEKRVFVNGLTEEVVNNADKIMELLKKGDQQRHVGRTNMNEHSSRSHTIFCIVIESRERTNNRQSYDGAVKVSRLNLVDLAGSERLNDTKAEGMRLKEACNINQSLFALGQVINKLSSGAEYIPFRDSKLTRILQPSLGGNAKTAIICTVTPAAIDQTHSTLQFASRAKTIKNKPEMREILSDEALLRRYKSEIENLKKQIDQFDKNDKLKDGLESLENEKRQMAEENQKLIEERNRLENMVISGQGSSCQKTKKRPNRRETWCFGARKFPLLSSDPIAAAAAIAAEVGAFDVPSFKIPPPATSSSSSISVSSDEFSDSKLDVFIDECGGHSSDEAVPKKKRRRAVHFSEMPAFSEDSGVTRLEIGCQTEDLTDDASSSKEELQESLIICEALMQEKDQLRNENELMHQQIMQLKEENQQVNAAFITMEMESDQVKLELNRVREEFIELREFTSIEQEVNDTHYKDMEMKHHTDIEQLNQTIEGKEKEIKKLRRSICFPPSAQVSDSDQAEKEQLAKKVEDLEKSLEDAEIVLMDTNRALSEMKDSNVQLEKEMESLKKKLQQLENEKSDFQASIEIQKEKSDRMCADLRTELQMTYRQLAEAWGEEVNDVPGNAPPSLQELQETIESLTKESESLKEDLQLSITSSVEIQEDLINCQEELEKRSDKSKILESEIAILQNELESARTFVDERGGEDLAIKMDAHNQENEELGSKVLALQEELQQERIAADEILKEHDRELEKMLDSKAHECEVLNLRITSLEEELIETRSARTEEYRSDLKTVSLEEELQGAIVTDELTGIDKNEIQARLDVNTEECEVLNSRITSLEEELVAAKAARAEVPTVSLQDELREAIVTEENIGSNENEISEMQARLDVKTEECEVLNDRITSLEEELVAARAEVPMEQNANCELNDNPEGKNVSKTMSLQEELREAIVTEEKTGIDENEIPELYARLDVKECEILNNRIASLEEELVAAKAATAEVPMEKNANCEFNDDLEGKNVCKTMSLQDELREANFTEEKTGIDENEISQLHAKLDVKTEECEILNNRITSLEEELVAAKAAREEVPMEQNVSCEFNDTKTMSLQDELREAIVTEENTGRNEISEMQAMLDVKTEECEILNDRITSLEEELVAARAEVSMEQNANCELNDNPEGKNVLAALAAKAAKAEVPIDQNVSCEFTDDLESKNVCKTMSLQEELEEAIVSERNTINMSTISDLQEKLVAKTCEVETLKEKIVLLQQEPEQTINVEERTSDEYQTVLKMQEVLHAHEQECGTLKANIVSLQDEVERLRNSQDVSVQERCRSDLQQDDSSIQEAADDHSKVMSLQEELEQAAGVAEEALNTSGTCDLHMCLTEKMEECETLKGMVNTLLEQLETAKLSTGTNFESDLKVLELEQRLKLSKDYEVELESEIEMLRKEQLTMFNDTRNSEINVRDELMDTIAGSDQNVSEMTDAVKENDISQMEEQTDNVTENNEVVEEAIDDESVKDKIHLEAKVIELQGQLEEMSGMLAEMSHKVEHSEEMLKFSKDYEVELERQLEEASKSKELRDSDVNALEDQIEILNAEKTVLQTTITDAESKLADMESKVAESEACFVALETKLEGAETKGIDMESTVAETEAKIADMECKIADLTSNLADSEVKVERWKNEAEASKRLMTEQSMSTDVMSTKLENYRQTADRAKGALLAENNRDLDQQRRIESLEYAQKESVAVFQQAGKEKDEVIAGLEKKSRELLTKLRQAEAESDQATHRSLQLDRESQDLRERVKELENHAFVNSQLSWKQELDPAKLAQRMKQLEFNLDITKQKSDKFEKLNKELKDSNKRYEANEFKANDLEKQLRDVNFEYERHRTHFNQMKSRYDNIVVEIAEVKHKLAKSELKNAGVDTDQMKNDLCTLEKENHELKESISLGGKKLLQLENAAVVDKKKQDEAEENVKALQVELQHCKTTIYELELELQQAKEDTVKYISEIDRFKEEIIAANNRLLEVNNEQGQGAQQELANQSIRHQHEMDTLQEDAMKYMTEMEKLKEEKEIANERLMEQVMEAEQKIENIQQELEEQSIRHQEEINTLQEEAMKYMTKMENLKEEKEVENESLQEQMLEVEQKMENIKQELEDQSRRRQQEIDTLQEDAMKCKAEIEMLKEEKELANDRLNEREMEAEGKIKSITQELEDQSIRHHQEMNELQEDAMKCKAEIEMLKEEKELANDRLNEREMEAEGKIKSIKQELEDQSIRHHQEMNELQADAMKYMTKMEILKQEKEAADERLHDQEMEAELESVKQELADQTISHCQEIDSLKGEYSKLESERDSLVNEMELTKRQQREVDQLCDTIQVEHEEEERKHKETKTQLNKIEADAMEYMTKMEILKQEKEAANERLHDQEMEAERKIENAKQNLKEQSIRHQQEIDTLKCTLNDLRIELASLRTTRQGDQALGGEYNDLKLELEEEQQDNKRTNRLLKEEQDKYSKLESTRNSLVSELELVKRQQHEVDQLCDTIQEEHEEEERKHKETKIQLNKLESKHTEIKSKFVEVSEACNKIKKEKKEEERDHKNTRAKLAELEANVKKNKNLANEESLKVLQEELLEKKIKIVSLESEILKCTDPLEKRILQLKKELADSSEKVESWKKEASRLRKLDSSGDSSTLKSEAGSGYGIIQECAVFTLKAENAKLEQELKRSRKKTNDLEKKYNEKSMFYHEEVTRNTSLRAELKRCMEKLQKVEMVKEKTHKISDVAQKRPLNDIPTNSPVKKASKVHTTVERLPTSSKPASTTTKKNNDWDNFLQPAIEQLNEEDKPQQCTQQ